MVDGPIQNRGRDEKGRFSLGNEGGPGNPLITEVHKRRKQLYAAVRDTDMADTLNFWRKVRDDVNESIFARLRASENLMQWIVGRPEGVINLSIMGDLQQKLADLGAARGGAPEPVIEQPPQTGVAISIEGSG